MSIALSLLLLLSSSGISYSQHFCGGMEMMAKLTLGEAHLSCGMDKAVDVCDEPSVSEPDDDSCCNTEYTSVETDDTFVKASFDVDFDVTFAYAFVSVFVLDIQTNLDAEQPSFSEYNPPPLDRDLPVLYQTFLI
ncbi:HYC_CC_PP family protein [Luteirhabdus pelagi]|uniref:HYC_CC_PP family protein n=1 Tax=Luteirhabdus pelagi TaxID=2792783 RepID=UPI00193ADDBA|nr:hypothetical protein [Luteirhabdus pelagi]